MAALPWCMVRPSGTEAPGARRCGQAGVFDELRARVSSWPPLRPARLRRERGSVVVVQPTAPLAKNRRESDEARDRYGHSSDVRRGGVLEGRAVAVARSGRHDPFGARGLRPQLGEGRRGGPRGHRQRDGGGARAEPLRGPRDHGQSAAGEGDRPRPRQDRQDRRRRPGVAACGRLLARGVVARCRDRTPAPPGGTAQSDRPASHPGEERNPCDPGRAPGSAVPARRAVQRARPGLARTSGPARRRACGDHAAPTRTRPPRRGPRRAGSRDRRSHRRRSDRAASAHDRRHERHGRRGAGRRDR